MLSHQVIAAAANVTASSAVADAGAVYVLHGILGCARNWSAFSKRIASLGRGWDKLPFVLVDQRCHDASRDFAQTSGRPNTIDSCAQDLAELAVKSGRAPAVIIGHSMGGKVAMRFQQLFPDLCKQFWILDAMPGLGAPIAKDTTPEPDSSQRLFAFVEHHPGPFPSRKAVHSLAQEFGFSHSTAAWLTSRTVRQKHNVVGSNDHVVGWGFDVHGVQELRHSYMELDVWNVLDAPLPPASGSPATVDFVYGAQSKRWNDVLLSRLLSTDSMQRQDGHESVADTHNTVRVHRLDRAGHWLHADNPDGLLQIFQRFPPRLSSDHA
ncbi:hypothetical protein CAOG_01373 [Capsaspora owczarzaki ATCC 30864]|uniref:AB hydrolase-1 domain-containing protein n=1 Tax=Capsaspora owczarzaki (strain ATCC 30864) TaxID=595528 RepID=A0A0D2WK92_CAPO3|nr:hypothetical protein CAOG_01373 [Capsaspora owczarzaki ATCC 30864]KJE89983.1 hypothetical protein CAOG_001373 [Capsaspora owczarzaki ATCC 30864]|eukprot:XP_004349893.1 hypothetical protein CAOG_01373 [Capsaspora owczarzaki ATCC 30864]